MGRAECAPASDLDSALVWEGDDDDPEIQAWTGALAGDVLDGLRRCGLRGDTHGADATDVRFARSVEAWQDALTAWIADPRGNQGLIYLSLLADARVLSGEGSAAPVLHRVRDVRHDPQLLRLFARLALSARPPTGFLRDSVLDEGGGRRRRLDIKGAGLNPVTSLARYAGLAAGSSSPKTPRRLAAAAGSVLAEEEARTLAEAFHLMLGLRIEHQLGQIRAGAAPDDQLDAGALNPLTRRYLREAFRAVTGVQRAVQRELGI
jgi:CBS domain-containing protein